MNGCDYRFHNFQTTPTPDEYSFTADVVCSATKVIEVHVYLGHSHRTLACTLKIGPQNNLEGGRALTTTGLADDIDLGGTITGMTASREGSAVVVKTKKANTAST